MIIIKKIKLKTKNYNKKWSKYLLKIIRFKDLASY